MEGRVEKRTRNKENWPPRCTWARWTLFLIRKQLGKKWATDQERKGKRKRGPHFVR